MSRSERKYLLKFLSRCTATLHLKALTSLLIVHGVITRHKLLSPFLESCFRLGAPRLAISTFKVISKPPSVYLLNLIVNGLSRCALYEDVLSVYGSSHCQLDHFTAPSLLKACSALEAVRFGRKIHGEVLKRGFGSSVFVTAALADHYANSASLIDASKVVDEIHQPDLVCFNVLIAGYSCNGFDCDAFEVLKRIFYSGLRPNSSTLACVFPVCARLGRLDTGRLLHGFGIKHDLFENDFLVPALISMYTSTGCSVSSARKLFDSIENKSVATWNSMVSAYSKKDMMSDAFKLFGDMLSQSTSPDLLTFVSILTHCGTSGYPMLGFSIHTYVMKLGFSNEDCISNALLTMYAKVGQINAAELIFSLITRRNTLAWNALIAGYGSNELWTQSLGAFNRMVVSGVSPDAISLMSFLSACSEVGANFLGRAAHTFVIRKGFDTNINLLNALVSCYVELRNFKCAFSLFESMHIRTDVSWNTLISGCVHHGDDATALDLVQKMQREAAELNIVTIISILPIFGRRDNLVQGQAFHGYAIKKGFESDVCVANSLISMYSDCGSIEASVTLFEAMVIKSTVSWNVLMTAYRNLGLLNQLLMLFYRMIDEGWKLNAICLLNLIALVCSHFQGKSIHALAILTGSLTETTLVASLISMYGKLRNVKSCIVLFEMGGMNISVWNAVISAFVLNNMAEKAIHFFNDLRRMGMKDDKITLVSVLSACIELSSIYLAQSLIAYVVHKGFLNQTLISNVTMDLAARCGDLSMATSIFANVILKDTISWNSMINSYSLHGKTNDAFATFWNMQLFGFAPNHYTYSSLLSVCNHTGLVERAFVVFTSLIKHGMSPKVEHYECILDMLGRAGRFSEVFMIAEKLPFTPRVSVLGSILDACRLHCNVKDGERLSQMMSKLNADNVEPYLTLSCIYSEAGRWEDAEKLRSLLDKKQSRKFTGLSLQQGRLE